VIEDPHGRGTDVEKEIDRLLSLVRRADDGSNRPPMAGRSPQIGPAATAAARGLGASNP